MNKYLIHILFPGILFLTFLTPLLFAETPVIYPNNPATIYAVITLDGTPVTADYNIAAYVNNVCRGTGTIVLHEGQACTTMLVNLAQDNENVLFRLTNNNPDSTYQIYSMQPVSFGQVWGESVPYLLNFTSAMGLQSPIVSIETLTSGIRLSWSPVSGASYYHIYRSFFPFSGYSLLTTISAFEYSDLEVSTARFYKVKASDSIVPRGADR